MILQNYSNINQVFRANQELETFLVGTLPYRIIKFMIWGYGIYYFISVKSGEAIKGISCKNALRLHIRLCKILCLSPLPNSSMCLNFANDGINKIIKSRDLFKAHI